MSSIKRFVVNNIIEPLISQNLLKSYAEHWVKFLLKTKRPKIIAVTGTVGKTTTKEFVVAVLQHPSSARKVGVVDWSHDNLNVDVDLLGALLLQHDGSFIVPWNYFDRILFLIKVPFLVGKALFKGYPEVFVLECGVCSMSDLQWQASLIEPDVSIVTTIGAAHLQKFKTIDGLVSEKGALVRAVKAGGLVILGEGHHFVRDLEGMARVQVVKVKGEGIELSRKVAEALVQYFGISDAVVKDVWMSFEKPAGRLGLRDIGGLKIIDDSYNANPLSMEYGLRYLKEISSGRKVAILGSMAELGENEVDYHKQVGSAARDCADIVLGVGSLSKNYSPDLWYESVEHCCDNLSEVIRNGDTIFVKGSGSMRMSMVVERIVQLAG